MDRNLKAAIDHIENEEFDIARKELDRLKEILPNNPDVHYGFARLFFELEEYTQAEDAALKSVSLSDRNFVYFILLGDIYEVLDRLEPALQAYEKAVELGPEESICHFSLGLLHLRAENLGPAEKRFSLAVALDSQFRDAWANLAYTLENLRRYEEAISCWRSAINLMPDDSNSYRKLGDCFFHMGKLEEAIDAYGQSLQLGSDDMETEVNLAHCHFKSGNAQLAQQLLKEATRRDPNNPLPYTKLAEILEESNNPDGCEKTLKGCIELFPNYAEAHCQLGYFYKKVGDRNLAILHFREAIAIKPRSIKANYELAILLESINLAESEVYHRKLVEILPLATTSYLNLAKCLNKQKCHEEAEIHLLHVIKLDPQLPIGYFALGEFYRAGMDFQAAKKYFEKALELQPNFTTAYLGLGLISQDSNNFPLAKDCYKKALRLDNQLGSAWNGLGAIYYHEGDHQLALNHYDRAMELAPDFFPVYYNAAQIPSSVNPKRDYHFFRAAFLCGQINQMEFLPYVLEQSLTRELPLLHYRLLHLIPLPLLSNAPIEEIQETSKKLTEPILPFVQLFNAWKAEASASHDNLIVEAIISYYLGDPIHTFDICDRELDTEDRGLDLCSQYYFILASNAIGEEGEIILENAYKQAADWLGGNHSKNDREVYYAALILITAGHLEKGQLLLESLMPRFVPAGYQLIRLFEDLEKQVSEESHLVSNDENLHSQRAKEVLKKIQLMERTTPTYLFGIETIAPPTNPVDFLEACWPLIHMAEFLPVLSQILLRPHEMSDLFINGISFSGEPSAHPLSLRERSSKAWLMMTESDLDANEVEDLFAGFSRFSNPARRMGEYIENGAKALLLHAKEGYSDPTNFNFKLYIALNYRLLAGNFITQSAALTISEYIYSTIEILPLADRNPVETFVLQSVKDHFLDAAIPYLTYAMKLNKLIKVIRQERIGKNSPILSYHDFDYLVGKLEEASSDVSIEVPHFLQ